MKRKYLGLLAMGMLGATLTAPASSADRASDVTQWEFDVYLNDKKVGKHLFEVSESDGFKRVQSEARFKYTILLIPAYRYEHSAAERWSDQCLAEIDASTNANGDKTRVSGEKTEFGFRLQSEEDAVELPECIMTFAYWNPNFLDQSQLLNPQTGEYVDVVVEELGEETLKVRGEPIAATRFRLTAYEIDVTLWYSPNDEWLALESVAKGGHIIRYELS
ncbi:MAG: DUF6134 family protein [Woeseiaceae bacterium]